MADRVWTALSFLSWPSLLLSIFVCLFLHFLVTFAPLFCRVLYALIKENSDIFDELKNVFKS